MTESTVDTAVAVKGGRRALVLRPVLVSTKKSKYRVEPITTGSPPRYRITKTEGSQDSIYPVGWSCEVDGSDFFLAVKSPMVMGEVFSSIVTSIEPIAGQL